MPFPSACQFCLARTRAHPPLTRAPLAPARAGSGSRQAGQPANCCGRPAAGRRRPGTLPCRRASPPGRARGHCGRDRLGHPRLGDKHPPGAPRRGAAAGQTGQAAHALRRPGLAHRILAGGNDRGRRGWHHNRAAGRPGGRGFWHTGGNVQGARGFTFYRSQSDAGAARPARRCCGRTRGCRQAVRDHLAPAVAPVARVAEDGSSCPGCRHDECTP